MKKYIRFITIMTLLAVLCAFSFIACDEKEPQGDDVVYDVKSIAEFDDMEKGYFGESYSTVTVDLNEYFTFGAEDVVVTAESSDASVASAEVVSANDDSGKYKLNITALKGGAEAEITVKVSSELANVSLEQKFNFKANLYSKIACVGDSLTYGHSWPDQAYPVYLAEELGSGFYVENFGKNGASITGYNPTLYLKYAEQAEYEASIDYNADIVVMMLGTNDSKGWADAEAVFETDYKELINSYMAANPDVKIIFVTAPPTMADNKFSIPSDIITNNIVPLQKDIADYYELPVVDFSGKFFDMSDHDDPMASLIRGDAAFDGVHLTEEGAQYLAGLIAEAIRAL